MSDLGETLRDARHRMNLTLDDVARATRIKVSYLSAIEDGEYSTLPGPAYVTGFLRNYARFLGLQPDDLVQKYRSLQPAPPPSVRAATRVLANGHQRAHRARLFWFLAVVVMFVIGAYIVKQYSQASAHASYQPPNVTASLAGTIQPTAAPAAHPIRVYLRAQAPVWIRVTVDGRRAFQGYLDPAHPRRWVGVHSVYITTFNGPRIRAWYDGHPEGRLSSAGGILVQLAGPSGWHRVS
ncbi:MAG TPA: helix-turn-helix domain-containing protein [Chloroflexota bacterium]|nr:helix-turn-helix domain-containing protein [Chloroflexota bacterium]